jgi:hypothetical protein
LDLIEGVNAVSDAAVVKPEPMPTRWVVTFGTYLLALNLTLVYVLVKMWPGKLPVEDLGEVSFLWGLISVKLWVETRYLLIVAVTGALGSYVHLATSFADYLGNRQFYRSWGWWYLLRPFIGTALALIFYFGIRGGLLTANAGAKDVSPYGLAAIAGLAGLFSKQAADKLKEVFESLFKVEHPPRADKLQASNNLAEQEPQ